MSVKESGQNAAKLEKPTDLFGRPRNGNQVKGSRMMENSRRTVLQAGAVASAGLGLLPGNVLGVNGRLNIAFIGAGGKGWHAIRCLTGNAKANFVAFADVDEARVGAARAAHPAVPFYADFRTMLDKHREIDGVIISTPDHTHHYIARYCMKAGKHVYLEKPLAHNIAEVRDLMALEKKTGLACQMGNQGHSSGGILLLDEWIKAGVLGEVREIHAWCGPNWTRPDQRPPAEPVPETLDWDKWLGPAAEVPYSSQYLPAKWRSWYEFGCGSLGDWFCHNADAPYYALGLDCPSLVEIESTGPKELSFPESAKVTFSFPAVNGRGELQMNWYQGPAFKPPRPAELEEGRELGNKGGGTIIVGSKATVMMPSHAGTPQFLPYAKHREMAPKLPRPNLKRSSHWNNWLLAIRGEEQSRSSFAYGGRLTETMHFANIALHLNRSLKIDSKRRAIIGDDEATALMSWPAPRDEWRV